MKKHQFIGLSKSGRCCILSSLLSFQQLDFNNLEPSDFKHDSTNWGGADDLQRTLKLRKFTLTGNKIILSKPLKFHGKDYDCGSEYSWDVEVVELMEVSE